VISKANPLKLILSRPILNGQFTKWAIILEYHNLVQVTQRIVKGKTLVDFLLDHPIFDNWELNNDLLGEDVLFVDILPSWEMYFDGPIRQDGANARVVFTSPQKHIFPYSFVLTQLCSNNMKEY